MQKEDSPDRLMWKLADLRQKIAALQAEEARLAAVIDPAMPRIGPRPGWPIRRLAHHTLPAQAH